MQQGCARPNICHIAKSSYYEQPPPLTYAPTFSVSSPHLHKPCFLPLRPHRPPFSRRHATVIFVPLYLLYRVRITPRRKIAYASLLCLSIFMVIICVIRVSAGELPNGTGDQVWIIFWTAVEATTAVIMFSLTALPRLIKKARRSRARAAAEAAGRGANVRVAPLATAARRRMERRLERSRDWFRSRTGTRANREEIEDGWAAEERGVEAKGPRPPGPVLLEWRNGDDMTLSSTSSTPPKPIELQRWNAGHTI